jgi:hypothetical protein
VWVIVFWNERSGQVSRDIICLCEDEQRLRYFDVMASESERKCLEELRNDNTMRHVC